MSDVWHDDSYERNVLFGDGRFPDDSDGYREYNGLPVDLVYEILLIWRISHDSYYELRGKILEVLGSHFARNPTDDQICAVEQLVKEYGAVG